MDRPHHLSKHEADSFDDYAVDYFDEHLIDGILGRDVTIYEKTMYVPGVNLRAIVQNVTTDVLNLANVRQIICHIGTLKSGQYVENEGRIWLINSLPDNNGIYEKAIMWYCKHTVSFVSPISGDTVEYPVYSTNSTQYGTGERVKPTITVIGATKLLWIPYNEETVLLDNGHRFVIDKNTLNPTVYRLTQVDTETMAAGKDDGLIQWSILQDQSRAIDDVVGKIADNTPGKYRRGSW
jgi:hypothetical protein